MLNRLQDVFRSFQRHNVKYVVIGGVASILHGVPRATFDPDILIDATPDNAQRLLDALIEAGLGTAALTSPGAVLANESTIFINSKRAAGRPVDLEDVRLLGLPDTEDAEPEGAGDA